MKPSKFSALVEAARDRAPAPPEASPSPPTGPAPTPPPALPQPPPSGVPGRPRGKRSDPDFEQVTAYLPSALYTRVKIALLEDGRRQEFSDLVAVLLSGWVDDRTRE